MIVSFYTLSLSLLKTKNSFAEEPCCGVSSASVLSLKLPIQASMTVCQDFSLRRTMRGIYKLFAMTAMNSSFSSYHLPYYTNIKNGDFMELMFGVCCCLCHSVKTDRRLVLEVHVRDVINAYESVSFDATVFFSYTTIPVA
jgi:hypothetical protein